MREDAFPSLEEVRAFKPPETLNYTGAYSLWLVPNAPGKHIIPTEYLDGDTVHMPAGSEVHQGIAGLHFITPAKREFGYGWNHIVILLNSEGALLCVNRNKVRGICLSWQWCTLEGHDQRKIWCRKCGQGFCPAHIDENKHPCAAIARVRASMPIVTHPLGLEDKPRILEEISKEKG